MKKLLIIVLSILLIFVSWQIIAQEKLRFEIVGLSGEPLKNANERLNSLTDLDSTELTKVAGENVKEAIKPFGYFNPHVESFIRKQDSKTTLVIRVNPGRVVQIQKVKVGLEGEGKKEPTLKKFLRKFPLKTGQPLNTQTYEKAKEEFFQLAYDQGYLKAEITEKSIQINLTNYTANITLIFNTGPRFYFGKTHFNETPFKESFLQRFVSYKAGEPFSTEKLLKFQQDLNTSRYFQEVIVTPQMLDSTNYDVPVNVALKVPKAKQYNFGVGYGTFTGPRVTLGMDYRRVGESGQHFTTQLKLSPVLMGFAAKYFIPGSNPITDQYTVGADIERYLPKNGHSFSETLSAGYVRNNKDWQYGINGNYLNEQYKVVDQSPQVGHILYPSFSISRVKKDDLLAPTKGSAINWVIQGASQSILSSTTFLQTELKAKYIFSPTLNSRVIVRGDVGYTVVHDLTKLPLTLRFFAGGLGSIRGYPYSTIGPGKYLKTASVEYRHKIYDKWDGAVFYDAGNASDTFNAQFLRGDGVGIIYNSIIGPVQFYVARAESIQGKPLRIEFSIGPEF